MMIEVFGPGCFRCEKTAQLFEKIIKEFGREDDIMVAKITNPAAFAARGVMMTPAVIIDGVMRCQGRIPKEEEARSWITGEGE